MISRALVRFINKETAGAVVLLVMVAVALFLANSVFVGVYQTFLVKPFQHAVNDGLMVFFFLLVGLEVKREIMQGELSTREQAILPFAAAVGGMIVPVIIYMGVTAQQPALWRGWAIPSATDIAFALGALAMLGRLVPPSLKVFLTALAIIDDVGAVLIIGLFYTDDINLLMVGAMLAAGAVLYAMNRLNVSRVIPYLLVGAALWYATIHAGLHGTVAGVLTALAIPLGNKDLHRRNCPLRHLEHLLHPWVIYGILPLFALLNAGLVLDSLSLADITAPLPLAIVLGLFFGKQIGIFAGSYVALRWAKATLPADCSLLQLYGAAVFGGIGFTMSQFIATLAFPDPIFDNAIKLGVIGGSVLSAVWGLCVFTLFAPKSKN